MNTCLKILEKEPNLTTLLAAVRSSGLAKELAGDQPITFFAPVNEAFQEIPAEEVEILFQNKEKMLNLLHHHMVTEIIVFEDLKTKGSLKNFHCKELTVSPDGKIQGSKILQKDIKAGHCVIHMIDHLIMP